MYSNFPCLAASCGLEKLSLKFDYFDPGMSVFPGTIRIRFVDCPTGQQVGFRLLNFIGEQPSTLELDWQEASLVDSNNPLPTFSPDSRVNSWIVNSLLKAFSLAVQQTLLEIYALNAEPYETELGTSLSGVPFALARTQLTQVSQRLLH